jgi:magnesium chelatase family protein
MQERQTQGTATVAVECNYQEEKSMLARRLTSLLQAMTLVEAIETTRIHSVAGLTGDRTALVTTRPFRAPHHTISDAGLIGGSHVPMPGEVSLAHRGGTS